MQFFMVSLGKYFSFSFTQLFYLIPASITERWLLEDDWLPWKRWKNRKFWELPEPSPILYETLCCHNSGLHSSLNLAAVCMLIWSIYSEIHSKLLAVERGNNNSMPTRLVLIADITTSKDLASSYQSFLYICFSYMPDSYRYNASHVNRHIFYPVDRDWRYQKSSWLRERMVVACKVSECLACKQIHGLCFGSFLEG